MSVLVDTSVWSMVLRRSHAPDETVSGSLRNLILGRRVEIIGPIRQELLSGVREEAQFKKLQKHLAAFPDLALETDDYVMAAKFFNLCRIKGVQGSNTDFLICAVAVRRQLSIYAVDQDFLHFAKYLPIMLYKSIP